MSDVEQELDQHKGIESPREQTTTAEKRNACEPGLDLESNAMILNLTSHSHRTPLVPKQAAKTRAQQLPQRQRTTRPQGILWRPRWTGRIHREAGVISLQRRSIS